MHKAMALGKNIKKAKLIPEQKPEPEAPKKVSAAIPKKQLLDDKKKSREERRERRAHSSLTGKLFHYITEQTQARRAALREKYMHEIQSLADKDVLLIRFEIGNDSFAVDIAHVKEVVPTPAISKVPGLPDYFKGAVLVRKKTVLALDLGEKLRVASGGDLPFTLVLKNGHSSIGLLLNDLPKTWKVKGKQISGAVQDLEKTARDETFIKGLVKDDNKLVFYLDVAELINSDRAVVVPDELVSE